MNFLSEPLTTLEKKANDPPEGSRPPGSKPLV